MSKIRVNVKYDERNNRFFYRDFEIVEELPECKSVKEAYIDISSSDKTGYYKFYECTIESDEEGDEDYTEYYAISKYLDKDITVNVYPANIEVTVSEKNQDPLTGDYDSQTFNFQTDGLEFEDTADIRDYVNDTILLKVEEWFCLNDDDINTLCEKCENALDKYRID